MQRERVRQETKAKTAEAKSIGKGGDQPGSQQPSSEPASKREEASLATNKRKQKAKHRKSRHQS